MYIFTTHRSMKSRRRYREMSVIHSEQATRPHGAKKRYAGLGANACETALRTLCSDDPYKVQT